MKEKGTMRKNRSLLPLCRSTFLQDVVIALGQRSLKSLRYSHPTLTFEVAVEEIEGATKERLNIEARATSRTMTKMVIWEDGVSWVYFRLSEQKDKPSSSLELHANLSGIQTRDVADLIYATLSDFKSVRGVWQRYQTHA
jgi:hypothetical protein